MHGFPTPSLLLLNLLLLWLPYHLLVFLIKTNLYKKIEHLEPPRCQVIKQHLTNKTIFPFGYKAENTWLMLCSPDYWWSFRFKDTIKQFDYLTRQSALSRFIKSNNKCNFWVSFILTSFGSVVWSYNHDALLAQWWVSLLVLRYFSRSIEIAVAFSKDVFEEHINNSGLNKHERIRLAIISYFEIYIYSAGAFLSLLYKPCEPCEPCKTSISTVQQAILASLNVGTLTNVGFVMNGLSWVNIIIFVQVFATISLVVLSLASYISRKD